MKIKPKPLLALLLIELLLVNSSANVRRVAALPAAAVESTTAPLMEQLQKPYLDLFEQAPNFRHSGAEILKARNQLKNGEESCVNAFKKQGDRLKNQLDQTQNQLKRTSESITETQRHDLHCRIQNLRALRAQADVLARQAIPVAYDNRLAKLEIIEKWPAEARLIQKQIADKSYLQRRWGDVNDIGFRKVEPGQKDDIKAGEDAIAQMKMAGLLPKELDDPAVTGYVRAVADKVAARSDLEVPLHVVVLNSREINAFALPGGFLYIERGLLEAADDESELAGVIAHEISHVTARHSHKLMTKATIAGIVFQAAQVAAIILTGGVAGIGTYYALQYGFYGLGLVLDLKLLGVSREYELQADQLGIQYAWNAGYDPTGFTRFFDKIATKEGYVNGVSWFRTHPPFYQRMVGAQREIMFLPKKDALVRQTSAFGEMKTELAKVAAHAPQADKNRPSLSAPNEECPPPKKIEYKPDEPIEKLCSSPNRLTIGKP